MTSVASSTPPVAPQIPKQFIIHNDKRIDDYYWLNERDTKPVLDYLKAENDYTLAKMRHTEKLQKTLYEEMRSRIKEDGNSVPYKFGNYVYYTRTKENMQYEIYCRRFEDLNGKEQITLDLNNIVKKYDYLTLSAYKISPNEKSDITEKTQCQKAF